MARTIEEITDERRECYAEIQRLQSRVDELRREEREVKFAEANRTPPHKWTGKIVEKTESYRESGYGWSRSPRPLKTRIKRGKVKRATANEPRYRNYRPDPGEDFVISLSGSTAYPLNKNKGAEPWVLAAKQEA